jgi:hypothetical protein
MTAATTSIFFIEVKILKFISGFSPIHLVIVYSRKLKNMSSLLGAIIGKFTNQFENVATEGLAHILSSNKQARNLAIRFLNSKHNLPNFENRDFEISTQFTDGNDQSIPDLAFLFGNESKILIEVKFWAKLTKNQPLSYLQKLNGELGESLFFLVPKLRIPHLKNELVQKVQLETEQIKYSTQENSIIFDGYAPIVLVSWEDLFIALNEGIDSSSMHFKSDLDQLQQMIEKMLSPAFLPFEVGDFEFYSYRKNIQLIELIDACIDSSAEMNTKNLSYGGGRNSFQRWFMYRNYYSCGLELHARFWEKYNSPVWLVIYGSSWQNKGQIPHPEVSQFEENVKTLNFGYEIVLESGYRKLIFKIDIPYLEDKDSCIKEMKKQMNSILNALPLPFESDSN